MESQPQNPEFRNNPENLHPFYSIYTKSPLNTNAEAKLFFYPAGLEV